MNEFAKLKNNWKRQLVSSEDALKDPDELTRARLDACGKAAMAEWDILKAHKKEDAVALFGDKKFEATIEMTREYARLKTMALGYATYGTVCYKNEELLADILWGLEFMYTHYYGRAEIEGRGWRGLGEANWYDWTIATPSNIMEIMLLVDEHLSLEQKKNYIEIFNFRIPAPKDYASNKVNFGRIKVWSGILTEREEHILIGRDGIDDTYLYADGGVNDGQGFYRDGSYIFHTHHSQTAMYGTHHFYATIALTQILHGSKYAVSREHHDILYAWLYDTFFPVYARGSVLSCVSGRHPQGEALKSFSFLKHIINLYTVSDGDRQLELASLVQYIAKTHPNFKDGRSHAFFDTLSLQEYLDFCEIMKKDVPEYHRAEKLYAFNSMDRVISHRENYTSALSMSSSRIYNFEALPTCPCHKLWYLGDGMLYIYSAPHQYDDDFWDNVDFYRMPGTTVDNRERAAVSIAQQNEYLSSQDFVGTLSCGKTGVAAMQLESYHSDGELISSKHYAPDGSYGGPPPARECTLFAKKSYFFVNNGVVCLGSDIHADDGAPVYTVIENRKDAHVYEDGIHKAYAPTDFKVNGKSFHLGNADTDISGVERVSLADEDIVFFDKQTVTAKRTEGDVPFTQILWQHGVDPKNEKYAYAIVPTLDVRAADINAAILANTENVQAVKDLTDGAEYYVFWHACELGDVSVDAPLLVAVCGSSLYVCDVTHKLTRAVVTYKQKKYAFELEGTDGKILRTDLI